MSYQWGLGWRVAKRHSHWKEGNCCWLPFQHQKDYLSAWQVDKTCLTVLWSEGCQFPIYQAETARLQRQIDPGLMDIHLKFHCFLRPKKFRSKKILGPKILGYKNFLALKIWIPPLKFGQN